MVYFGKIDPTTFPVSLFSFSVISKEHLMYGKALVLYDRDVQHWLSCCDSVSENNHICLCSINTST